VAEHDGAPSAITHVAQRTRSVAAKLAEHVPRELLGAQPPTGERTPPASSAQSKTP
jgi:hypothetical protein